MEQFTASVTLKQAQIERAITESLAQIGFEALGSVEWGTQTAAAPEKTEKPPRTRRKRGENGELAPAAGPNPAPKTPAAREVVARVDVQRGETPSIALELQSEFTDQVKRLIQERDNWRDQATRAWAALHEEVNEGELLEEVVRRLLRELRFLRTQAVPTSTGAPTWEPGEKLEGMRAEDSPMLPEADGDDSDQSAPWSGAAELWGLARHLLLKVAPERSSDRSLIEILKVMVAERIAGGAKPLLLNSQILESITSFEVVPCPVARGGEGRSDARPVKLPPPPRNSRWVLAEGDTLARLEKIPEEKPATDPLEDNPEWQEICADMGHPVADSSQQTADSGGDEAANPPAWVGAEVVQKGIGYATVEGPDQTRITVPVALPGYVLAPETPRNADPRKLYDATSEIVECDQCQKKEPMLPDGVGSLVAPEGWECFSEFDGALFCPQCAKEHHEALRAGEAAKAAQPETPLVAVPPTRKYAKRAKSEPKPDDDDVENRIQSDPHGAEVSRQMRDGMQKAALKMTATGKALQPCVVGDCQETAMARVGGAWYCEKHAPPSEQPETLPLDYPDN